MSTSTTHDQDPDPGARFGHPDHSEHSDLSGHFGQWLSKQRKARDLTQEELAERLGCSVWAIQKIEVGKRRPSKQVADVLAHFFHISPQEREVFLRFARGLPDEDYRAEPTEQKENLSAVPVAQSPDEAIEHPNNLPVQLTSFVGRDAELPRLCDLMLATEVRLLTLTGPPGTGKTRLALQVAVQLLKDFEDGVYFVNLASITDPDLVMAEIAQTLGVISSGSGARSVAEVVKVRIKDKHLMLVLDNFEQVVEAASTVAELLMAASGLKVITTSRVPLHIRGEKEFPVSPLHLPDLQHLPSLERLGWYESVQLFVQRAADVSAAFELTADNASAVAHICARLDGLPLAIELAAARVKVLSPQAILSRLESRLYLITGGHRDLPARQRTLQSAIEWSYDLLDEEERTLFRRLGVFVGGFSLEGAEAICVMRNVDFGMWSLPSHIPHSVFDTHYSQDVLEGISSLVDKSLVRREQVGGEPRFMMLESIREYAAGVMEASGEAEELRRRHALHFLDLAERADLHLTGEEQAEWFQWLEREHSNLVAAMSWSLARGEQDISLRFGGALANFWYNRYPREGRWWVEGALERPTKEMTAEPSLTHARALYSAGIVLRKTREYPRSKAMFEESVRIYRALDDKMGIANSLLWLAKLLYDTGQPEDKELAGHVYDESLERFSAMEHRQGTAGVLGGIGESARIDGDYPRAISAYERALAIQREVRDKQGMATTETNLAYVLYHCGEYEWMKGLLGEALHLYQEVASAYNIAWALFAWAGIERAQGDARKAATLIGAANALASQGGTLFDPVDQRDREAIEAAVRADLSEQEWVRAQEQGRAMSLSEAVAHALNS